MKSYKIALVENEDNNIFYIKKLISTFFLDIEIVGVAKNAEEGYQLITTKFPDIIILDIELNDSNGFDILKRLEGETDFQVIACTSHEKYAIEAFGYNVIDFLLKPFKLEDLVLAINKAKKQLELEEDYRNFSQKLKINTLSQFFALSSSKEAVIVKPNDILYLKSDGRYTMVTLVNDKQKLVSRNMGIFEKLLDPNQFFRVHHSYIVNLNYVISIDRPTVTFCLLENGKKIPVSTRKASSLERFLNLRV